MKTRKNFTIAALLLIIPVHAQISDGTSKAIAQIQAKKDALEALKNGDQVTALAKLSDNLTKSVNAPKAEIQLVAQLTEASYWLANAQHPRAIETALFTISQSEASRSKLSRSEDASALTKSGELYERVIGNSVEARKCYEAALQRDGSNEAAALGLKRLNTLQDLIDTKARENEALRVKAQITPR